MWEASWAYGYCARYPQTFEGWNRIFTGWKYRIAKYMPAREASLLLYDAIKNTDVRKELRAISMDDIMSERGLDLIYDVLSNAFMERKNTNIQSAMRAYELVRRDPQEGVRVYTAKFRDAERVMTDAKLRPYEGEARGSKYLT